MSISSAGLVLVIFLCLNASILGVANPIAEEKLANQSCQSKIKDQVKLYCEGKYAPLFEPGSSANVSIVGIIQRSMILETLINECCAQPCSLEQMEQYCARI